MLNPLRLSLLAILILLQAACGNISQSPAPTFSTQSIGTCTVTSTADNGDGTLRALINNEACSTITFGVTGTITLSTSQLSINRNLTIVGPEGGITISGANAHRVILIGDGAAGVQAVNVTLENLTITNGRVNHGAGIYVWGNGILTLKDSTVSGNTTASGNGGGLHNNGGTVYIYNSTFVHNVAPNHVFSTFSGGGIYNVGHLTVVNSTFTGNSVSFAGGAIHHVGRESTTLTVLNSTVVGNSASRGGGISVNFTSGPTPNIRNSIVAGNRASFSGFENFSGNFTLSNNVIVDSTTGWLGPLQNNGGRTHTMALLNVVDSPALDKGDPETCGKAPVRNRDQRGFYRVSGAQCDIGAYELSDVLPPPDTTPPVIAYTVTGTLGDNGWYTSNVTIDWTVVDHESKIASATGCSRITINVDQNDTVYTCTATSEGGMASESVTINIDKTAPSLNPTVSSNPVLLGGSAIATPDADDSLSGIASANCNPVDTSRVGSMSVSCTATDRAGNTATESASYNVIYSFSGFAAPLNDGAVNVAKAGQTIPLKWRITDASGDPITTLTNVTVTAAVVSCSTGSSEEDPVEQYASGNSGLQNLGSGDYQFNWKTPTNFSNSCRIMHLNMGEGITRTVNFRFTR